MLLRNTFTVPVPVGRAWDVLQDAERVLPCLPGATLDRVDGDGAHGRVAARLGPLHLQYQGRLTVVERHEDTRRAVLHAAASESRGGGTARATIAASLTGDGDGTTVTVVTDLAVTGRLAQAGPGLVADAGEHLVDGFARNLAAEIAAGRVGAPTVPEVVGEPAEEPAAEAALDLGAILLGAARPLAAPFAAGVVVGWLLSRLFGRRATGRSRG